MSSENRTSVPNSLNEHWMPFTSNKDFKAETKMLTVKVELRALAQVIFH